MRPPIVCLYLVGVPPTNVAAEHGTYEPWFDRLAGDRAVTLQPFDGRSGRMPPDLRSYDGFVITGSAASLTAPEPWMEAGVELVRYAYGTRVPLLGVCFGHQLIGAAFGGSVKSNPAGWQIATYAIDLNEAGQRDPLFEGVPQRFEANLSHRDIVDINTLSTMNSVEVLATNGADTVQAIAAGPMVRGIQFHPEFNGDVVAAYIRERRESIAEDATARGVDEDQPDRRIQRTRDTPVGEDVFRNFLSHWIVAS